MGMRSDNKGQKMTLTAEAKQTILRLKSKQERTEEITHLREVKQNNPMETMFPIPKIADTLLYYKVDLFVIPDVDDSTAESAFVKVQLRTEDSVRYNYENEESTSHGTRGFKYFKASLRVDNINNRPSSVIDKQLIDHPFYVDVIAKRKEIMNKYKKHNMLIKPYLSNFYEPTKKNHGTFDFCSTVVSWENQSKPEVYIRMGDWEFHEHMELYTQKTVRGLEQQIFTSMNTLRRDYNPKRRTL